MNNGRLWTLGNKLRASGGEWDRLVMRIMEGTYCMVHLVLYASNESWNFASTWMELEGIMISEISQAEKDNYHMASVICGT